MTTAEQAALKADYRRDGYAVARGFMSRAEVADINARIDALIDRLPELDEQTAFYEVPGDRESIMRLQYFGRYDQELQDLYESERFVGWPATCSTTPRSRRSCSGSPSRRAWAR